MLTDVNYLLNTAGQDRLRMGRQQRTQQNIFSELGQVVPKVLTTRAFPDDFKVNRSDNLLQFVYNIAV